MTENIEEYRNQVAIARTEIKNLRQQLSALKHEHLKDIKLIKSVLNQLRCSNCTEVATTVASKTNASTSQDTSDPNCISFTPIGVIETTFLNKRAVPRQPSVLTKSRGAVVIDTSVFNNPEHALSGLEEFSHMWIIFYFHATENSNVLAKVAPPRLGGERRGVFSTRSPHRPCPIGLSLVKIQCIEDNKIYFHGVDMVSGTPVLDIKPYIPQYDYPNVVFGDAMTSLVRPPTEGINQAVDGVAGLQVDDNSCNPRSLSPRIANSMGVETQSPQQSPYEEEIPSPVNPPTSVLTPVSPASDSPSTYDLLDGVRSPIRRLESERGAPDGQERFTPPQSALMNLNQDGIRVAPWISNPPTQTFEVKFTDDALERLNGLIGDRAHAFKSNIECLLSEDPRSHYVRTRYPDHEYSCVLEDLSISCVFDTNSSSCTIIAVRNAEDLQET